MTQTTQEDGKGYFWKVKVDCWYREKPRSRLHKRVQRTILVQAVTGEAAFDSACQWARECAPIGNKWVAFEPREAATVKLPLCVLSNHNGSRPAVKDQP